LLLVEVLLVQIQTPLGMDVVAVGLVGSVLVLGCL
jgi:hypothetical protein